MNHNAPQPRLLLNTTLIASTTENLHEARHKLLPLVPECSCLVQDASADLSRLLSNQDIQEFPVLVHHPSQAVLNIRHATPQELQSWPPEHST